MKIWSKLFLVLATGMMMFSSCLENIEPEGLNDLRGAKADLLRAETALIEAKAARENAEAALALAKAKIEEAKAAQEAAKVAIIEAEALLAQYKAERQALENAAYEAEKAFELEQKIAAAEAAKAAAELEAQKAAAELELYLLEVQTQVLQAQAAYERALKDLAVSKVALTKSQVRYLRPFWYAVSIAEDAVDVAETDFKAAADALADALKFIENNKKYAVRWAEGLVASAEASLESALKAVEAAEAALEIDPMVIDWVEAKAEIEAELVAIKDAAWGDYVDGEKAAEYQALVDTIATLKGAAEKYTAATGVTFDEETGTFVDPVKPVDPTTTTPLEYPEVYIAAPVDAEGEPVGEEFHLKWDAQDAPKFYYGDASKVLEYYDAAIEAFEDLAVPTDYDYNKMRLEAELKAIEENPSYAIVRERYQDAVAAYKAGDVYAYMAKYYATNPIAADPEEYDVDAAIKEYNDALDVFVAALKTYNDEHKKYTFPTATDNPNTNKDPEVAAALEALAKTTADATVKHAKAVQAANDAYAKANDVYYDAKVIYKAAAAKYTTAVEAAVAAVKSTELGTYALDFYFDNSKDDNGAFKSETAVAEAVTAIDNAIKAYQTASKEEGFVDEEGAYKAAAKIYSAELAKIKEAQKAFDDADDLDEAHVDATEAWAAANKAWDAAVTAFAKAKDDAEKTKTAEIAAAEKVVDDLVAKKNSSVVDMTVAYEAMLEKMYEDAYNPFMAAIENLKAYVVKADVEEVAVEMGEEGFEGIRDNYPEYLVDVEKKEFKKVAKKDLFDLEYFKNEYVKKAADFNAAIAVIEYTGGYYFYVPAKPADYPFSLPTYEDFVKEITEAGDVDSYETKIKYELAEAGIFEGDITGTYIYPSYTLATFASKAAIDANEAARETDAAKTKIAADHVKVLEAAKAEFEAYVVEAEASIDAIRAEVEAAWPTYYAKKAEIDEAIDAAWAEIRAYGATLSRINTAINVYVFNIWAENELENALESPKDADFDALMEALQAVYDEAVAAVPAAEYALEDAQEILEKIENDEVPFVEAAQKAYDEAQAELDEAIAELAKAAADLEKAMAAIGEGTAEEETPETPAE